MSAAALFLILRRRKKRRISRRHLRDRDNPLDLNDREFFLQNRVDKETFLYICCFLKKHLLSSITAYPVQTQVLSALRLLGSGSIQSLIAEDNYFQFSQSTMARTFTRVCDALIKISPKFIKFPATEAEMTEKKINFLNSYQVPNVVGVVGCSHIAFERTNCEDYDVYLNQVGKYTINVQIVCDDKGLIMDIVAKWPGSTHSAFIWSNCDLRVKMESYAASIQQPFCLVGDSGYPLEPWLLIPYSVEDSEQKKIFNEKLLSTMSCLESCKQALKSRFRCLHSSHKNLMYAPDKICKIILACAVLHNICIKRNAPMSEEDIELEEDDSPEYVFTQSSKSKLAVTAKSIRNAVAEHLSSQEMN